jgi:hypothetical protein
MRHLAVAAVLVLVRPLAAQSGLTIYSDGRVLVRRTVATAVSAGLSTHRLGLGALDPASVFALDSGVTVIGGAYDEAVDEQNTMRRAVGQTLKFLTGGRTNGVADTETAQVIGVNPERFRLTDGRIVFQRPGLPLYPAELMLADPTLALAIRSAAPRQSLRLGYFTGGASWSASYSVILGPGTARLAGQAVIPSQSLREVDADVQLLAGSVGGRGPIRTDMLREEKSMAFAVAGNAAMAPATEQGIGEAHLYSIPGKITLDPGTTTTVALFEPATAPWERSYVVRGQIPWYGPLQQYGNDENRTAVEVWYALKRQAKTAFGDLPLPAGGWRLYQPDGEGRLQLIGEAQADHTAPGQDVRLQAGSAFDLTARRVQTSYSTQRDSTRTIATAGYRVTVASAKDSAVTVEVMEERGGEWSVLASSLPPEKLSSTRTRFKLRVPAHGEAVLTYRVRVVW